MEVLEQRLRDRSTDPEDKISDRLDKASQELELLLQDFRLNPKRYVNVSVFGKKQKEYAVPENDPADIKQQN